jgi:hypothetical protein
MGVAEPGWETRGRERKEGWWRREKRRGFFVCVCSPLLLPAGPALLCFALALSLFSAPSPKSREERRRNGGVDRAARWSPRGAGGDKSLSWPVWNFLWSGLTSVPSSPPREVLNLLRRTSIFFDVPKFYFYSINNRDYYLTDNTVREERDGPGSGCGERGVHGP